MIAGERFVVLGVAQVRSSWFRDVARWATSAMLPIEFVKAMSVEEVRVRLRSGRGYSALLIDDSLPGADRDLVEPLSKRLATEFEAILLNTRVAELSEHEGGIRARVSGTDVDPAEHDFAKALIAVGRSPNTRGLGLEKTGVQLDTRGFVRVDHTRRTDEPSIFAIGDAVGEPMLAHKATHEGRVAVEAMRRGCGAPPPEALALHIPPACPYDAPQPLSRSIPWQAPI